MAETETSGELLAYVESSLRWPESMREDASSVSRLTIEIREGQELLARLLSFSEAESAEGGFDWMAAGNGLELMLLRNYVLYSESDALDEFQGNYLTEIMEARQSHELALLYPGGVTEGSEETP